jgi:2-polyprenyl-3-methyl-5-hydroxy-6-metoxy-1,4-benzoquinol methylase
VPGHDDSNRHWERWAIAGTSEEQRRLLLLEAAFDPFTIANLERIGVAEGWRCLELGAGAGSIAAWLAGRAGAENVIATDLRPDLAGSAADAGVRVLRHDVTRDPAPGDAFDLIHARALLEHLPARDEVIGRVAGWLAPGGWLLVEDSTVVSAIASRPELRRAMEALTAMLAGTVGSDFEWARRLPAPLERAGLTETAAELFGPVLSGGSPAALLMDATMRAAAPAMVAAGTITQTELDQVAAAYADPSLLDCSFFFIAGRGRR